MSKKGELPPSSKHWLDWRKEKHIPLGLEGNGIRISAENLARLKKELSKNDSGK